MFPRAVAIMIVGIGVLAGANNGQAQLNRAEPDSDALTCGKPLCVLRCKRHCPTDAPDFVECVEAQTRCCEGCGADCHC